TVVATPVLPGDAMQQWMCAAVFGVVRFVNVTSTFIVFAATSQVTVAVPLALDCALCDGFSFAGLRPGALGPPATNTSTPLPVRVMLAVASAFLPWTLSVAVSVPADAVGA